MNRNFTIAFAAVGALVSAAGPSVNAAGPFKSFGPFSASVDPTSIAIRNDALAAQWSLAGNHLKPATFDSKLDGTAVKLDGEAFELKMADGKIVPASALTPAGTAVVADAPVDTNSPKLSDHLAGKTVTLHLQDSAKTLEAVWMVTGRDGGSYVRETVTVRPIGERPLPLRQIILFDGTLPSPQQSGPGQGPVIVFGDNFFGLEHPISHAKIDGSHVTSGVDRAIDVAVGQTAEASAVLGAGRPGQLRRDFQGYVQRERAHPYRTFLHYNTWYDIGYFNRYSSDQLVAQINDFGEALTEKRGVVLSSFLLDDGWDDPSTLWDFNKGFPKELGPARDAAARYNAAPGVWLSPWGGYGEPHAQRLAAARRAGYETNDHGPLLSSPKYYAHFRDTCLDLVKNFGVNQFKFDGTGNASSWFPGSKFGSDFEAAISLIGELRAAKPDLFINLTTGTWPSPFWCRYADSIWRGGEDHDFAGVGTWRQKWITYRDAETYAKVASISPLYPLNSLMLHGIIYAFNTEHLGTDPGNDFTSEVRDYFGNGTQLQELYITPKLLTERNWDVLAEAANWSRANADTLVDTHWVGGDPAKLQVYGWAAWSPAKGIITLRNPSNKPASIDIDVAKVLELPPGTPTHYAAHSPWKDQQAMPAIDFVAGKTTTVSLHPFEVINLELMPTYN